MSAPQVLIRVLDQDGEARVFGFEASVSSLTIGRASHNAIRLTAVDIAQEQAVIELGTGLGTGVGAGLGTGRPMLKAHPGAPVSIGGVVVQPGRPERIGRSSFSVGCYTLELRDAR